MCVVSMVTDDWNQRFPKQYPIFNPTDKINDIFGVVTRKEFEALKKEIEALKALLVAAKKYDEDTGQPNCEKEENIQLIKNIAKAVGIDLEDLLD